MKTKHEGKRARVEVSIRVAVEDGYTTHTKVIAEQKRTVALEPEPLEDAVQELSRSATREVVDQVAELPEAANELQARREAEKRARDEASGVADTL